MNQRWKSITVGAVFGVALGVLGGALYATHSSADASTDPHAQGLSPAADLIRYAADAPQLTALQVQAAQTRPAPVLEDLPGVIAFNEDHTVRVMPPVAGRIASLVAEPGQRVQAGAVLAWIDAPEFTEALAALRKARNDADQKRRALDRAKLLLDAEVLARKDFESAQSDYDQARAELDRAQAVVRQLEPPGAGTTRGSATSQAPGPAPQRYALRAPIAGVVAERNVNPGMQVRPDAAQPLFTLTDPDQLWVVFELSDQDAPKVHAGQIAQVEVDALGGRILRVRIEHVALGLDASTHRVKARARLLDAPAGLRADMFVRVTPLADNGATLVALPNAALVTQGVQRFVFVEEKPGSFRRRRVEVRLDGRELSYLAAGVQPGERVVTHGALLLNAELDRGH